MSKNANEVRVEKFFKKSAPQVFQALAEGRLFNTCGAASEQLEIDFRIDGKYKIFFKNADMTLCGKFLEIVPDKKIRFTWGDQGSDEGLPFTEVTIDLSADGDRTRLTVLHTGFKSKEDCDAHEYGWTTGLDDLIAEMETGRLRIVRVYSAPREKLYAACANPKAFFDIIADADRGEADFRVGGQYKFPTEKGFATGTYEEIIPGKKIVFTWLHGVNGYFEKPTRVTMEFDDEDEGGSSLTLTHEGLPMAGSEVKMHRGGWEYVTRELTGLLTT